MGAVVAGGFLAAYAVWTGLSIIWSDSAEQSFNEADRVVLYLAVFGLAVLAPGRMYRCWMDGMAAGIAAVGIVALVSRLFPHLFGQTETLAQLFPAAQRRLSFPVDYWNGLATFMALGLPLLLHAAATLRSSVLRGLALAPVPVLVSVVYLSSSRGGSLAALAAVVVFFLLTSRRWAVLGAISVGAAASALALFVFSRRPELVDHPLDSALAEDQGRSAAVWLLLICIGTGAVYGASSRFLRSPGPLPRALAAGIAILAVAAIAVGVAAAHPVQRFQDFKQTPANLNESIQTHLFSGSSNGRWQLWTAGVDEFKEEPVHGGGAGSYEAWWAQHGELSFFVRDAHSLYVETLGELGVVGLVLLLGFFVSAVGVGASRLLSGDDEQRAAVAALLAVAAGYLLEAGIDWMWELTAVSVVAMVALGLLTGPGTIPSTPFAAEPRRRPLVGVFAVIAALALIVAEGIPLLATMSIRHSQDAAAANDNTKALDDALAAKSIQPWAASPYLQIALVREQAGQLPEAHAAVAAAIERDEADWRLWLVKARLETKSGQIEQARESLARARELNPRSPLLSSE
jgi:O-antigen ligase/polysaccharide polymerase Wzy-like membrane protein/tetratricopeptide repeat protein